MDHHWSARLALQGVEAGRQREEGQRAGVFISHPEGLTGLVMFQSSASGHLAVRTPLELSVARLQDVEESQVLRGCSLVIPLALRLVVPPHTEEAGVRLLDDVLGTVPEHELLIEAVPGVVLPGSLLQAVGEDLGVVALAVRVAAAEDVAGRHREVTGAVVLVGVLTLTLPLTWTLGTCNSSSGGGRGRGGCCRGRHGGRG